MHWMRIYLSDTKYKEEKITKLFFVHTYIILFDVHQDIEITYKIAIIQFYNYKPLINFIVN